MKVIFSEDCIRQIKTIKILAKDKENKGFKKFLKNISLCVKSLIGSKSIDDVPFGRRFHGINSDLEQENLIEGRLKKIGEYDLSDLASRDLDRSNRLAYFSYNKQSVILISIGHYGLSSDKNKNYKNLYEAKQKIEESSEKQIVDLSNQSEPIVNSMLELVKDIKLSDEVTQNYNDIAFNKDILPISIGTVEARKEDFIAELFGKYKEIDKDKNTIFSLILSNNYKFKDTLIQIDNPVDKNIDDRINYFKEKVNVDTHLLEDVANLVAKCCNHKNDNQKKEIISYVLQDFVDSLSKIKTSDHIFIKTYNEKLKKLIFEDINRVNNISKNELNKNILKPTMQEFKNKCLPERTFPMSWYFVKACMALELDGTGLKYKDYKKLLIGIKEKRKEISEEREKIIEQQKLKSKIKR